jgi:hypothetical protein
MPAVPGSSRISLHLDLDLGTQPIEGEVRTVGGHSLPFVGWLGLTAALEQATQDGPTDPTIRTEDSHVS